MDKLITLNQLKEYDAAKTNILNNKFDTVYNYVDDGLNNVNNQFNVVDNNVLNLSNYVNNVHNELNEAYNNFNVINMSVENVDANNLNIQNLAISGTRGMDGQFLGINGTNLEWKTVNIPSPVDVDNFVVNNITVNNSTTVNYIQANDFIGTNATINNTYLENVATNNLNCNNANIVELNVTHILTNGTSGSDNQFLGINGTNLVWKEVNIPDPIDKDNFVVNNIIVNNIATINGFNITAMTIMAEDDYNNLDSKNPSLFYLTTPNGNLYLKGYGYSPSYLPPPLYSVYVNLSRLNQTITTQTLILNSQSVTNYNGSFIYGVKNNDDWDNSYNIGLDAYNDIIQTKANYLYIYNADAMYYNCRDLKDTFICNSSLIINAPLSYDPMKYCVSMNRTFQNCHNFNQPITIPESVQILDSTFRDCSNFNQPIIVPNNVENLFSTFRDCGLFNSQVIIGNGVIRMSSTFENCETFNQPIVIPDSVINMQSVFRSCSFFNQPVVIGNNVHKFQYVFSYCSSFNQPITIPESVNDLSGAFLECSELMYSSVPIHISHNIALGDTSNYIYNALVNNLTGIRFSSSRILNDA